MKFDFNFYIILGIKEDASSEEIKKAYRVLSKKFHPDMMDTGDEEMFKKISIAYSILKDPEKRKLYDLGKWSELEPESDIDLSEAEQNVVALFQSSIEHKSFSVNSDRFFSMIVENIRDSISKEIDDHEMNLSALRGLIESLNKIVPKIKFESHNTKHNLLKMAVTETISLKEQEMTNIREQIVLAKEMYGILQDFYFQDSIVYRKIASEQKNFKARLLDIPGVRKSMLRG